MRKNIFMAVIASALLCLSQIVSAVPAKKGNITVTQPDGSTIIVKLHGDEWFHYITDVNGNLLEENDAGYLVRSTQTFDDIRAKMTLAQKAKQIAVERRQETIMKANVTGAPKIPVILVQFTDKKFSISDPKTAFTNLLSQKGYSANGGTGSVLDYYRDQSRGAFSPQFVVMDVVTLDHNMSYYGSNDNNAALALYHACQKLDSTVDFSQFDNDGDRKIDMALMYFAGYNEAESTYSETIWPHQFYVPYVVTNAQAFDGVTLNRYFCTSELKGYSGTNMCGIGTTCHEFAHSIGLPDFYDTDYDENGEAGATYKFDVMCDGAYNNSGCTPPWMNAEELIMLGWMNEITSVPGSGSVSIPSIGATTPVAYKSSTSDSGEYFLYECRPGTGWDAGLQAGLLVYHVDKSTKHNITWSDDDGSYSRTAYQLWNNWTSTNAINVKGSHPCFYIVPSGGQTSLYYSGSNFTFPGSSRITTFTPIEWAGTDTGISLSQIAFNSTEKVISFNVTNSNECSVSGVVTDTDDNPIAGATVTISAASASSAPSNKDTGASRELKRTMLRAPAGASVAAVLTDESGAYSVMLDNAGAYVVEVSKNGYVSKSVTIDVSRPTTQNFSLLREGEELPSDLFTYPTDTDWYIIGNNDASSWSIMCANYYPSSMLNAYEGKQIKSLSFAIHGEEDDNGVTTTGKVYGLLDFGSDRQVCIEVENPVVDDWITIDLLDQDLIIPAGKDIFAGYALDNWAHSHPMIGTEPADLTGYWAEYDLTSTAWMVDDFVYMIKLTVGSYETPETGYNFIEDPNNGVYPVGSSFALNLTETSGERKPSNDGISWFYDDEPVSGSSINLNIAGEHVIKAMFTTEAGKQKIVELELHVN